MVEIIYGTTSFQNDRLIPFFVADKTVRGAVANGIRMVREMRSNHALGILKTLVPGYAYLAATLLSSLLKGDDSISLKIDCFGPIKGLTAEANTCGEVRGYLKQVSIPLDKPLESFGLSSFLGANKWSLRKQIHNDRKSFMKDRTAARTSALRVLIGEFQRQKKTVQ